MKCPLCNTEATNEQKERYGGGHNNTRVHIGCGECQLYAFDKTPRKAKNKFKKLKKKGEK